MKNKGFRVIFCSIVYIFLFLPISVIVVNSFNATTTKPYMSWKGFTLDWYVKLWDNSSLLEAFSNTMIIAIVSTVPDLAEASLKVESEEKRVAIEAISSAS